MRFVLLAGCVFFALIAVVSATAWIFAERLDSINDRDKRR